MFGNLPWKENNAKRYKYILEHGGAHTLNARKKINRKMVSCKVNYTNH